VAKFFGVMLIALGALLAGLCGLCTLVVAGGSLSMPADQQGYGAGGMVGIALLLGGVPTVFGLLMIFAGVMLLRAGRQPPAPPPTQPGPSA
jgi:hypothetical protein